ncbi:VhaSFD [Bugula neritina]|uniref:V-type proton ATPase subunit H n=1 Tax=Bugula neritina TaxID=10212 RepID=A0A7J7JIY8_BUGNE|nr:VhaSFD [Bugula neritina]
MPAGGTSNLVENDVISKTALMGGGVTSPLQLKAAEVRSNRVNWQSYKQGQMISLEEYGVITRLDFASSDAESRALYLRNNSDLAAKTFYKLIQHIAKDQTIQYLLVMIDDLIIEDHSRVEMFKNYAMSVKESPWTGYFTLLTRSDGFIVNQASAIITKMACWGKDSMDEQNQHVYVTWLRDQLRIPNNDYTQSVCRCLQILLRIDGYRKVFFEIDGVSAIVNVLSSRVGFQLQYQLTFCLWCLTFNEDISSRLEKYNLIPILADILSEAVKEKVLRIILATYRNLLEKPEETQTKQQNALSMVQCKLIKQLEILTDKKFEDEDVVDDIKFLSEFLETSVQDLSSFDEYVTEIKSGRLEWSPVHKEIRFWRENAPRLNEKNYELLRTLVHLLNSNHDPLILSVAAHDIGEYVRHYPRGKHVLEQIGGKEAVMKHLAHEDPNVRYEALLSVQKLMVHNW